MLERLTAEAGCGDTKNWEAGGQSNFMIAASRLGLRVASTANLGQDVYGDFMRSILQVELRMHCHHGSISVEAAHETHGTIASQQG